MKSGHEIRESLPGYLRGSLPEKERGEVSVHLRECEECRAEAAVLEELLSVEPPDPGELFWSTLPRRVRLSTEEKKGRSSPVFAFGFKGLFAAAAFAVVLLIVFSYRLRRVGEMSSGDLFFHDPLSASVSDYSGVTESDIPPITAELKDEGLYLHSGDLMEESYRNEVASLNGQEIESVYEALGKEGRKG
ncbi:MAG: zf-HC2 domain-containing protein [Nitrospirae bacterium]|nr:zf-HC2 domain-containing protein [Nitrospirota bacterium]